jgi:ABC-type antimicrobial peptide transport system permease subunit
MLPVYYVPMDQSSIYAQTPHLFFRPRGDMLTAERVVRRVLQSLEPNLPAVNVHAVRQNVSWMEAPLRLGASAFTAFGALAAIVATIGLYSVLSFLVVEQRRAHAVKLALGAQPSRLARGVVGQAMTTVAVGMAIGYVALVPLAAVLEPMLFHTRLVSIQTLLLVTGFGVATALLGALMPVRSILRTDAAAVLRE